MNIFPVRCFDPEQNSHQVKAEYGLSVTTNVTREEVGALEKHLSLATGELVIASEPESHVPQLISRRARLYFGTPSKCLRSGGSVGRNQKMLPFSKCVARANTLGSSAH